MEITTLDVSLLSIKIQFKLNRLSYETTERQFNINKVFAGVNANIVSYIILVLGMNGPQLDK